ncbi:hypothetical protein WJX79_010093 [Trebouxia sp. C0005]
MSGMTPDQLKQAASQASASLSAQEKYQLDGANSLKAAGNQLHSSKQYTAAIDKYTKAKSNLTGQPSEQAKDIRKACMLNICSCHLNLGQLDSCAKECTEVLSIDASNRKALYRRGQAYSGLSRYAEAVQDLTEALDMSPANEKEVDPAMMQQAANMMSSMDPAQLESMSRMAGASAGMQISPEMLKSVSTMMSSMSPEMMQSMMSTASSSGASAGAAPAPGAPAASGQQSAAGQQMPAGGPQMGPEMMDQIQQRLSDPATADLISAFTQTMKPEDLAGLLKSGGMDVTSEQAAQYLTYAKRISPANMRRLLRLTAYGVPVYTLAKQSRQFLKRIPLCFGQWLFYYWHCS